LKPLQVLERIGIWPPAGATPNPIALQTINLIIDRSNRITMGRFGLLKRGREHVAAPFATGTTSVKHPQAACNDAGTNIE
jgi:hypothetical protein